MSLRCTVSRFDCGVGVTVPPYVFSRIGFVCAQNRPQPYPNLAQPVGPACAFSAKLPLAVQTPTRHAMAIRGESLVTTHNKQG